MEINKDTKLIDLINEYPWAVDLAKKIDERFAVIDTPIGRMLIKKYTLEDVSRIGKIDLDKVISEVKNYIDEYENKEHSN